MDHVVKYSWAYDKFDNKVHIKDVSRHGVFYLFRGKQVELVAHIKDDKKARHFAQKGCSDVKPICGKGSGETEAHRLIKEFVGECCKDCIEANTQVILDKKLLAWGSESYYDEDHGKLVLYNLLRGVDNIEIEAFCDNYKPDISLYKNGSVVKVIEIVATHDLADPTFEYYRENKIDVIRINVDDLKQYYNVSELIEDKRNMQITAEATLEAVMSGRLCTFVYLNNMPDVSAELNLLSSDIKCTDYKVQALKLEYNSLLSCINQQINNIVYIHGLQQLSADLSIFLSGYQADILNLRVELESLRLDYGNLTEDLNKCAECMHERINYVRGVKELNNKLSKYWVKTFEQFETDRAEMARVRAEEEKHMQLKLAQDASRQREKLRRQQEIADSKNGTKKRVNKRAHKSGVHSSSLVNFFGIDETVESGEAIEDDEVKNSLITDGKGFYKFLKDEGY